MLLQGCESHSYEECVIDGMKGVSSNTAALQIRRACELKFNKKSDAKEPTVSYVSANQYIWSSIPAEGDILVGVNLDRLISNASIRITNSNEIPVNSVTLARPESGICERNKKNYKEFITCTPEFGRVESISTKELYCSPRIEHGAVCLVGVNFNSLTIHD
jgi:hypothetical protein